FPVLMLRRQRFEQQTIQPQFLMLGIGDLERSRGLNDPAVAFRYPFVASAISQHSLTARYGHQTKAAFRLILAGISCRHYRFRDVFKHEQWKSLSRAYTRQITHAEPPSGDHASSSETPSAM